MIKLDCNLTSVEARRFRLLAAREAVGKPGAKFTPLSQPECAELEQLSAKRNKPSPGLRLMLKMASARDAKLEKLAKLIKA